jgi:hypothetical protein
MPPDNRFIIWPAIRCRLWITAIECFPEDGLLSHSPRTAVVDGQGRLLASLEGNAFTAAQLGELNERMLTR